MAANHVNQKRLKLKPLKEKPCVPVPTKAEIHCDEDMWDLLKYPLLNDEDDLVIFFS